MFELLVVVGLLVPVAMLIAVLTGVVPDDSE